MRAASRLVLVGLIALTACETVEDYTPSWIRGANRVIKRAPGERIDVIFNQSKLEADSAVASEVVDVPEQTNLPAWNNRNDAMQVPHPGLTGITNEQSARVGDGNDFTQGVGPAPVVAGGLVIAMDAAGIISAHKESDIDDIVWTNKDGVSKSRDDVFGGGLTVTEGILYATTGNGGVRAITLADGKLKWKTSVGAPVRGAPASDGSRVYVITADNQTLALDAPTGAIRWSHRGIREAASFVTAVAPVVSEGIVVSAYSSGELFALRAETGNVIWNDTLGGANRTHAAAVFGGIDADPIVGEGVVVGISATGEIQATALMNGRPLWQKRMGGHNTPWSAGNVIYVLADTHDLAAIFKKDGSIRWASSLAVADPRDPTHDITPALYGPILAGNAVLVLDSQGTLTAFKPQDGARLNTYELAKNTVTSPVVANGALYIVTKDAKLYRYN